MAEPPEGDPLRLCVQQAKTVVSRIDKADLELDTPCESWTVREVLNAVAVKANLFAEAVRRRDPSSRCGGPTCSAMTPPGR